METYGDAGAINGDMLHQRLAKAALPILVNMAHAGQTISYSKLAEELTLLDLHDNPIHHRIIGRVAGRIADAMIVLSKEWEEPVPPLSTLVINKNSDKPGEGVNYFLEQYFGKDAIKEEYRDEYVELARGLVFDYGHWYEVLEALEVEPITLDEDGELSSKAAQGYGGGESEEHLKLKEHVHRHPELVTRYAITFSTMEYPLPSADIVDVYLETRNYVYGIEVKGIKSSEADILRGIYQCVKYRAVLEAKELVEATHRHVEIVLIISGELTPRLVSIKNALGVKVVTGVIPD